jgi:hypothetical protein
MSILRRIGGAGVNVGVLVVSIAVFFIALFAVLEIANSQKPPTMEILAAAHDLNVGDKLTSNDFVVKTVFVDDNSSMYIEANEDGIASTLDGIVVIPMFVGQPIQRTSIVANAGEGTRLSALLASYPAGGSLFPLPLDFSNVVAPNIDSFKPGDLINITVVISSRPQPPSTPTVMPEFIIGDEPYMPIAPQVVATNVPIETELDKAKALLYPPMSKDIFPEGVRVVEVQGNTELVDPAAAEQDTVDPAAGYVEFNKPKVLVLLVPDDKREELSLALQEGDLLVVSLLAAGNDGPTTGFSYWDYEEWLKEQREEAFLEASSVVTPAITPTLMATPAILPVTPTP